MSSDLRVKDVDISLFSVLTCYLVRRRDQSGELFPTCGHGEDWYNLKLLIGKHGIVSLPLHPANLLSLTDLQMQIRKNTSRQDSHLKPIGIGLLTHFSILAWLTSLKSYILIEFWHL